MPRADLGGRANVPLHTGKASTHPKVEAFRPASISTGNACRCWEFKSPEFGVNANSYRPTDVDLTTRRAALVTFYPALRGIRFSSKWMPKMSQRNNLASHSTATPNLPIPGTFGTTAQLCIRYQVSRTTWWRWSQMPGFPRAVRFGRSVRWPVESIEAFLTSQEA